MKTGMIIIIVVVLLIVLYATRCQCGTHTESTEKFCAVAPRFDYYYQANKGYPQGPSPFPAGYLPGAGTKCGSQVVDTCHPEKEFKVEFAQDEFMDEKINSIMKGGVQARDYEGRMLHDNQPINSNYKGFYNMKFEGFKNGMENVVNGVPVSKFTNIPPPPRIGALSMGPSSLPGSCNVYSDLTVHNSQFPPNIAKTGVRDNADTVGSPTGSSCRACGGEAISTSPKRDFYFQPEMNMMGTGPLNGMTFYKAI